MGALATVATICQGGVFRPTVRENVERMLGLVEEALTYQPDLICLPETFPDVGVRGSLQERAEPIEGPTVRAFAAKARAGRCYLLCPLHLQEGERVFNVALLLDREGEVAGIYRKVCPVTSSADYTEFEHGVTPGADLPVFDLDFGRVGVQICFDIGFPENWQTLADRGARLVVWPSAYDGGFPLRVYAYLHHYYVVSSTRTGRSRIIDPCGEVLVETSDSNPIAVRRINLDYVVIHLDWNKSIPDRIREKYGSRVAIRQWDPGSAHVVIEPQDPTISCAQLQEEFGFEPTALYHERHRIAYRRLLAGEPAVPQQARHGERPQYSKW
ncbi:MAG: hypothetical protein KatS3mg115_1297 [Candidatus Poribacteria bacterium]|nr:MAG: hypothetical protein KatS3mg115_1297 [Candidatus Poribacteria bacterium]